jgi:hypothetical protein
MPLIEEIEKLKYVDYLIRTRSTGSRSDLARKLGYSERHVNNFLKNIEYFKGELKFDRNINSYVYINEPEFIF